MSPYPTSYPGTTGGGASEPSQVFLPPLSRRHSLLGSSCARWGVEPSSRSAYRRYPPDPNGVVVLHMSKTRPGRAPPLPRGRWCAPDRRLSSGRHLPLSSGQSLRPRLNIPIGGGHLHEASSGVHSRSPITRHGWPPGRIGKQQRFPPVFSSPAAPGWNRTRFGLHPGLRTLRLPAAHAEAETGHRALARVLHLRQSAEPPNGASHFTHAPSRRT
jgi:hypothetical protein